MMRRVLVAIILTLAAAAAAFGQANAQEARKELDLGARAYRGGRFAEAEQRFRRALELDPEGKNTRLFIARAVQQQYKPGVQTPENLAAGERAVAAYQEVLAKDPANEDAYKAVIFLHGQMKNEDQVLEFLLQRANDFSLPNGRRAEAFTILASKRWQCSYDITEQKENKATVQNPDKVLVQYKMPADQGDFLRARQCVSEGLQLAEQAVSLSPKNANAWSYKANLLREGAKLAEMEGDAGQQAEYMRQYEEALEHQKRTAQGAAGAQPAEGQAAPAGGGAGEPSGDPAAKGKVVVSGGVLNGKAVSKPQPAYPPIAKAAGASGTVTVRILVDEEGNVVSAAAVSGHPLLQQAAVAAARQAKFSPTLLSGQPVKVTGVVTYNFVPE
ncbi:MAG TPA: energy transducer TonB [Pyrinomonadaceae bacterium]|jgi:TonB family protein